MRQSLVGTPAKRLGRCLPAPEEIEIEGERELLTYRWRRDPAASKSPEVASRRPSVLPRRDPSRGPLVRPSWCELRVELAGGRVVDVAARGESADGLRADAQCLYETRRCVERSG